jgi:prepilin-type N-terminal cleavage/methylation domain-containing protein
MKRHGGFTLIEVICASAIMAVIALSLFTALRVGFQARDKALASVGPARAGEIAMDMVRRDLEAALPPRGTLAKEFLGQPSPETQGTSVVRFYAMGRAPETTTNGSGYGMFSSARPAGSQQQDPTSAGGIERVDLLVQTLPGGDVALVRSVTRNLLSSTEPPPEEEVLCRGVTAFRLRFFDGYQWFDEWDSTQYENALPLAVEVTIELTRPRDPTRLPSPTNVAAYRATRTFFLPCRDETLLTGGTQ